MGLIDKKIEFKNALIDAYETINKLNTQLFILDTSLLEVNTYDKEQLEFEELINTVKKTFEIYD
jgi:hypothetical protein